MALDYEKLLSLGVEGLIEEQKAFRDALDLPTDGRNVERYEFHQSCVIELEGVLTLQKNYADEARRMASLADGAQRDELFALAKTLDHVPAKPARTFREALQSVHLFLYCLYGIYSAGRPDQYLLPYYRRDIEAGILDEASAQELIDSFCLQYMNNMSAWAAAGFMIGGRDPDGNPVENALTWHFLTAIRHTHTPDPNVGFCVTEETSGEILAYAAEIIREGHGNPQIWNSDKGHSIYAPIRLRPAGREQFHSLHLCGDHTDRLFRRLNHEPVHKYAEDLHRDLHEMSGRYRLRGAF